MKKPLVLLPAAFLLVACGQQSGEPEQAAELAPATSPPPAMSIYAAAVANPNRLDGDPDSDAGRKPEAVLEFFGVEPGDVVLEMWAGSGYYTELLAHVVGENGKVFAHANTPVLNFAGEAHVSRHADGRLPNVEVLLAENNTLSLEPDTFDVVTIILNFHDLYWSSEQYGWELIDDAAFLAEIYKGLKPGGTLGIVDHRAEVGSPPETSQTLHRIDRAIVIAKLTDAGFVLDGESDVLANPDDDLGKGVFDPAVRGKTDRFVLRFVKPE